MPERAPADLGRFAEPSVLILASLAEGEKHGYAITQDVHELTGVALGPGTLYGALSRLETRGLIASGDPDGRRRPYVLTEGGRSFLAAQMQSMRTLATTTLHRLAHA